MQKHVEMDEPEEAPDLEQTLFGVADPTGPVIGEDEIDEEAVEEELEEDLLAVADENDVDLRRRCRAADEDDRLTRTRSPDATASQPMAPAASRRAARRRRRAAAPHGGSTKATAP